jgi:hypothetical protein
MSSTENWSPARGLSGFSPRSLREGAAALALWPKNADRHVASQTLVDALTLDTGPDEGAQMAAGDWAAWLAGEQGGALQAIQPDGLHDAPIAEEATVLGTRQGLLGGRLEFPALHYRLWMRALVGRDDPHLQAAQGLLTAAIGLCERAVEIADLGSYKWPEHEQPRPLAAPPEEEFERLRAALRIEFDDPEVAQILSPLVRGPEAAPWQPLSREAESVLLIADPWRFSLAALVRSLDLAARSPEWPVVRAAARHLGLGVVAEAAREMEWTIESAEEDHLVARADVDCLVVVGVGVISPQPDEFGAEAVNADADLAEWYARIASCARSVGADHSLLAVIGDGRAAVCDDPALVGEEEADPWILGLGELQTMGEALRLDPLGLPVALTTIARPPWLENFDLLDWVGMIRQREEARPGARDDPQDGTEHMLVRARMMAARHPALAPDKAGWVEVTRWEGVEDPAIYCHRGWDEFALLVRGFGRHFWVTCPGALERRYELLPVVATALAVWLARLLELGFLAPPEGVKDPFYARFRLELDRRPGPQLALASEEWATRIVLGPGFLEALCDGNNESDRMLVAAVLGWARKLIDGDPDEVLDKVAPRGRGTVSLWPHPDRESNPPRLGPPPPVEARFKRQVRRELAAGVTGDGEVLVASDLELAPALEKLARSLEAAVQAKLDSLEPAALPALVALHELSIHQSTLEAIQLPALNDIRLPMTYPDHRAELLQRDLVLRLLIERCAALPPHGSEPFGRRIGAALRAATELQLELRGALDTVRWEKAGGRVVVSQELGVLIDLDGELPEASEATRDQMLAAAPDLMAEAHSDWWGERPQPGPPPALDKPLELTDGWQEVDAAMAEEWGIALEQMARLSYALAEIADEQPDCVARSPADRVEPELVRRTAVPAAVVSRAVERLTLSPCPEFDTFREEHHPGRANRERSYMRRPLVALPGGELCWSSLHCKRAAKYLFSLIESGRLHASGPLAGAVTRFSQGLDRDFEDATLAKVEDCGWRGKVRVQELDGVPLRRRRGEEIGDVDVLAWSPERRQVWLLDAKRSNPALEPGPMLREGSTFEQHVKHHDERLRWVRNHLAELAREIGVETMEGWEIRAALVLDKPLTGVNLGSLSMPAWTLWALPQALSDAGS